MTIKATAANKQAVTQFNSLHPIGTPVRYWTGFREGDGKTSFTRTQAHLLAGVWPVVWVNGEASCIYLTHVEPIASAA